MILNKKFDGAALTVALEGDFCPSCITQTENYFRECLAAGTEGIKNFVIDFGKVTKFSNEGLMLILATKKKLDGKIAMSLENVSSDLYDKLDQQGVTTLITAKKREE